MAAGRGTRGNGSGPAIRLVCVDVDGTMVGSTGDVHPAVWPAAERARAAGIRLAICSGRPAFGITRIYAERLDPDGWHSFQNGASIVHFPSGHSRSARMPPEHVAMLLERAADTGRLLELYTDDDYTFVGPPEIARAHAALLGIPFAQRPVESLVGPIVRGQWIVPFAEREALLAEPHPGLVVSPSTSPLMPELLFVNLTPAGVDKGSAVRTLAAEYGLTLEQVMFVGDGWNDTPAMALVGCPVAMENAEPQAIALARRTVGHVDDGGLAEALALAVEG